MRVLRDSYNIGVLAYSSKDKIESENLSEEFITGKAFEIIKEYWDRVDLIIFIGSVGAVVRLIAPLLKGKEKDPAIVVTDFKASNFIPIIGGHSKGADQYASELALIMNSNAVFTSESKTRELLSLDSFGKDWGWTRSGDVNNWTELIINFSNRKNVGFYQDSGSDLWMNCLPFSDLVLQKDKKNENNFFITSFKENKCCWHPRDLWIGIGCERNTSESLINRAVSQILYKKKLAKESIAGIATVNLKVDEKGLISFGKKNNWNIKFFSADKLSKIQVPNPSHSVEKAIGTNSVAEASSMAAAGKRCSLIVQKMIFKANNIENGAVTIAISKSLDSYAPDNGELHLIGSGPGEISYLTADARIALSRCVVWIGYKLYLDQLEGLRRNDQIRVDSEISKEENRCKKALDLAKGGAKVALVSSGDIGIYGMSGLVYEIFFKMPPEDRPSVFVHPGISAFQLAAARAGAPIMSDFSVISLSDLLVDWDSIEKRLVCASEADFVTAIYNPKSLKRNWQLKRAIEIFLEKRADNTPVVVSKHLGREGEVTRIYRLDSIPFEEVNMFTVLIIGNTKSFFHKNLVITPRGYLKE